MRGNVVASVRDSPDSICQNGCMAVLAELTGLAPSQVTQSHITFPCADRAKRGYRTKSLLFPHFRSLSKRLNDLKLAGCRNYPFPSGPDIRPFTPSAFDSLVGRSIYRRKNYETHSGCCNRSGSCSSGGAECPGTACDPTKLRRVWQNLWRLVGGLAAMGSLRTCRSPSTL